MGGGAGGVLSAVRWHGGALRPECCYSCYIWNRSIVNCNLYILFELWNNKEKDSLPIIIFYLVILRNHD
ncbi:hypothetical protein HanIR_Chr04g0203631 [Helianthus annuus]|nr:hypothetical protein HanIR_Chr04g0203631 [Helianthus annuus]